MLTFHGSNSTKYINDIYTSIYKCIFKGFYFKKTCKNYIFLMYTDRLHQFQPPKKMEIGVCNLFFRILFLNECDTIKNFKK